MGESWECGSATVLWECCSATVPWQCHGSVVVPRECHGSGAEPQCNRSTMRMWIAIVVTWECGNATVSSLFRATPTLPCLCGTVTFLLHDVISAVPWTCAVGVWSIFVNGISAEFCFRTCFTTLYVLDFPRAMNRGERVSAEFRVRTPMWCVFPRILTETLLWFYDLNSFSVTSRNTLAMCWCVSDINHHEKINKKPYLCSSFEKTPI